MLGESMAPHMPVPTLSTETAGPCARERGAAMVPFLKVFGQPEATKAARADQRNVA